ncbi:MAG: hypothetical protein Q9226_001102 [Calogaya cf. arnoldii]
MSTTRSLLRSHKPKHLTISRLPTLQHPIFSPWYRLPTEMRDKILSYLLVSDSPINLAGLNDFCVSPMLEDTLQQLATVDLEPHNYRFFYRSNTFNISDTQIPAFLDYRASGPCGQVGSDSAIPTPRQHVVNLIISIQPIESSLCDHSSFLQQLLSCPRFKTLDIQPNSPFNSFEEIDRLLEENIDVFLLLGEKLRAENVMIRGAHHHDYCGWTLAGFLKKGVIVDKRWTIIRSHQAHSEKF